MEDRPPVVPEVALQLAIVRAGREDPGKRLQRALVELDHDGSPVRGRQPFQRRGANGPDRRGETGSRQAGGEPASESRTERLDGQTSELQSLMSTTYPVFC